MNERALNQAVKNVSADDYLAAERLGATRREFSGGQMIPKAGANRWHNLIATNAAIAIGSRLHGNRSEIYVNAMRVRLGKNLICYPDVVVVNGEPNFSDANADLLLNPTAIIEVFSSVTNPSDKTRKQECYLAIDSIKECIQIKADEMRVEHYARQNAKQWLYKIYNERDDVISLDSINIKVSLAEIYAQINIRQAELSSKAVN